MPPLSRRLTTNCQLCTWLAVIVIRLTTYSAIRKIQSQKRDLNPPVLALPNLVTPPPLKMPPPPQRRRLALGKINTILLKPIVIVGMSAPSLRTLISRSLRIREKEKSSIFLYITQILILRSRASFTKRPK
jgi:hypothetical protein